MTARREVEAALTGPGGPFEVVREQVGGADQKVYRTRFGSLQEVFAMGRAYGDDEFLVHGDRRVSFAAFAAEVDAVAAGLVARGVGPGDRVAVLSANNPEWCVTFWATVQVGAVLVGLNAWWKPDEVHYALHHSGAKVLVADRVRHQQVAAGLGEVPTLEHTVVIGAGFDELGAGGAAPAPAVAIAEQDPAVMFYTSGTTGRPKGAVSSHASMIATLQNQVFSAVASSMAEESGAGDGGRPVALLSSPLFHVSGTHAGLVTGWLAGMRLVIPVGRFDGGHALRLIEQERVTVWTTVPTMVWRVVEHPDRDRYDRSSVRTVVYGGSPAAGELQRRVRETFPNVGAPGNAYGLTETASAATLSSGPDALARPTSVGRPLPVVDLRIAGAGGGPAPAGTAGEILVKGPIVFSGYWQDRAATDAVLRDGWLHTGDIGYLDDEGFLYVTDRAKDVIIRGGENVYCAEIEERLVAHPAVADAAVIGVPHRVLGEEVKAVVQRRDGHMVTADELQRWVAEVLADFKVPAHVEIGPDPLPRNASGKLVKDLLRGRTPSVPTA